MIAGTKKRPLRTAFCRWPVTVAIASSTRLPMFQPPDSRTLLLFEMNGASRAAAIAEVGMRVVPVVAGDRGG